MYRLYCMYNLYGILTPFFGIVNRNHLLRKPRNAEKFPKRKQYQIDSLNLLSNVTVPINTPAPPDTFEFKQGLCPVLVLIGTAATITHFTKCSGKNDQLHPTHFPDYLLQMSY
jgi:hypothetical protein